MGATAGGAASVLEPCFGLANSCPACRGQLWTPARFPAGVAPAAMLARISALGDHVTSLIRIFLIGIVCRLR